MKSHVKRLLGGSAVYGLGSMLQRFLGLLLLPFFTRALTPADYGVMALLSLVTTAGSSLFTLGTGNSMAVLYFRETTPDKRASIVWTNAALLLVNGSALLVLIFLLSGPLSALLFETTQFADLLRIAFVSLLITAVLEPFYATLRMEERPRQYVGLTLLDSLITIALSIHLVLVLRLGVLGVLVAGVVTKAVMAIVLWHTVARRIPVELNASLLRPLVAIGAPSVVGLFAFMLIDYADRQMIQRMLGLDPLGVYTVGYSFGMVMLLAVGAFGSAWPPFFMSFLHKQKEARELFGRVLTYYLLGFGALTVLFAVAAKPLVAALVAAPFRDAYTVVGLVAAAYMLKGCYLILLPGVYYAGKLYLQSAVEWTAAIVNIALNLLLIPVLGIVGAAVATLASYLSLCVLAWAVSRRFLAVRYEWNRVALIMVSVLVAGASTYLVAPADSVLMQLTAGCAIAGAFGVFAFFVLLQSDERRTALEGMRLLVRSRAANLPS